MQFKNLFDFKNISRFIILAIIIFLFLPLIFPEKAPIKILKKESVYSHEDSPLPIFPKESLLEKYVNKLKKFYKMDTPVFTANKQNKERNIEQEIYGETVPEEAEKQIQQNDTDISKDDLFFSAYFNEDGTDIYTANANITKQQDNSVNLQKGTVITKDGLTLEPTQDGYYYNGKFYKNGTYPKNANRKHIEGALTRYHSRIAKNLGKKALYFADENGNLTVSYVNELPNEISTDIDTYLAQNKQNTNTAKARKYSKANNDFDTYKNSKARNLNNDNIDTSDIALASIRNMHAAYNLFNEKIKAGQIGQGILPKPNHLIPMGNIILNQTNIAQPPIENHEDNIFCQGDECSDSFKIAPIVLENEFGLPDSDLHNFYGSFCEDTCPYSRAYIDNTLADKPLDLDLQNQDDLDRLREEIANSDKKILEIAYIHPNEQYLDMLNSLQEMSLTNKNGETVEIRLRGMEKVDNNASFGDKMAGPFKTGINRDLASPENDVSYTTIVDRYNQVHENVQNNIEQNPNLSYYKEFFPDINFNLPVAFVEKSEKGDFFIINNPDIPKGYINEIPQWEKYKTDDGFGPYYKVPKNILFNAPSDLVIIAVQDGKKGNITLQDGHPIGTISKEILQNINFGNVESTKTEIANTQISTIQYNAEKLAGENNTGN